jgi:hypothetical protein
MWWFLFGVSAIIAAVVHVFAVSRQKAGQVWLFASLSFTALTVCALYSDAARRVVNEDWGGLMDIMPTMAGALWVCVIASILMNGFAWRAGNDHFGAFLCKGLGNGLSDPGC